MSDLQKEIDLLKARLDELEGRNKGGVAEPVKWQPKGGYFQIDCEGDVVSVNSFSHKKEFGTKRITREQANRAAVEMRKFNRLLALRDELCGDAVVNWENGEEKHYLYHWNGDAPKWRIGIDTYSRVQTPYFTSYELAQKACDMLNSGEAEL